MRRTELAQPAAARPARLARPRLARRVLRGPLDRPYAARLAEAAHAIARGRLGERVPVRAATSSPCSAPRSTTWRTSSQARLEELEAERARLREAISRFGEALAATHDVEQLLRVIVEAAVEATGAPGPDSLPTTDASSRPAIPTAAASGSSSRSPPARTTFGHAPSRHVLRRRAADDRELARLARRDRARERAAAPDRRAPGARRRADRASRTGASARTRSRAEIARAERLGRRSTLVLADLDDFKKVNDRHGTRSATTCCGSSRRCFGRPFATPTSPAAGAARSSC